MTFDYDKIPVGYYDRVYEHGRGVQSKWHRQKFSSIEKIMAGFRNHLDIGCGPGTFIGSLPGGAHASIGVDIAAVQIAYATNRYGGPDREFRAMQPGILPFDNERFDVVTLIELIEHLPTEENERLLKEALRVLRPGGLMIVSTPNYGGVYPMVEALVNLLGEVSYAEQHTTKYTRPRLLDLLNAVGAQDISVKGYMFAAPFFAALTWRTADLVADLEPRWMQDRFGLLMLGLGVKK